MKKSGSFLVILLFVCVLSTYAQYNSETYTVNISGVSCIILGNDHRSFDFNNNLGTYYADDDGVIRVNLPKGHYQYMALWKGHEHEPLNGTFHISTRNVSFKIDYFPPLFGIDTVKLVEEAVRLYQHNEKKKARGLFQSAADAGNVTAMMFYAKMCRTGQGGSTNKNHAYHYINKAIEHGDTYASYLLDNFNDKRLWNDYR